MPLDLSYPAILSIFGEFKVKGRTEHNAFAAWFLENFYHLDAIEVDDCICDSRGDKGVDAVYVNHLMREIHVFQTCLGQNTTKTVGDPELRELVGTLKWFKDSDSVKELHIKTASQGLKLLLIRENIASLIADGYEVKGVFLTNRKSDQNAKDYLAVNSNVEVFDQLRITSNYLPINKPSPISDSIAFNVNGVSVLTHTIDNGVELVIAPILASELVKMGGLGNQELFAWNLRYHLLNTPVNREIELSIIDPSEHKFFPAFHNGLTVLANTVEMNNGAIAIRDYAVVNGCQSLRALYHKSSHITPNLRILTKFVSVSPNSQLAQKITDHTNRQNGIIGRDLQSNNPVQVRIQTDMNEKYTGRFFYRIARGEHFEWDSLKVIENDEAARIMLAFDLKRPSDCHNKYKLFDELHSEIFGRIEVNAHRVVALWMIFKSVKNGLSVLEDKLFSSYSLTPFCMLFLLREILELPESGGREFCRNPSEYITANEGMVRLAYTMDSICLDIANMLVAVKTTLDSKGFDYKRDLKNSTRIAEIRSQVIPFYQTALNSKFAKPFRAVWAASTSEWKRAATDFSLIQETGAT